MKEFEIRQTVIEVTIVKASSEEEALEQFFGGVTDVTSYERVGGRDDVFIKEIK